MTSSKGNTHFARDRREGIAMKTHTVHVLSTQVLRCRWTHSLSSLPSFLFDFFLSFEANVSMFYETVPGIFLFIC